MKKSLLIAATLTSMASAAIAIPPPQPDPAFEANESDEIAWNIVEGLSTEIGPRMPGTEAEARARKWAIKELKRLGMKNVREEQFMMPTWVRGEETAQVISPFPQNLVLTALGNSSSTGEKGIEGEVVYFRTYQDLVDASGARVKGKIVFVDHDMKPAQDGSHYSFAGPARWQGPRVASQKGALAIVIRSIGTDNHRVGHTGNTSFAGDVKPIPAAALSNPDADNLVRIFQRAPKNGMSRVPVRIKLKLTPRNIGEQISGNVIAEIPGRDPSLPLILVACHLDSWDLGTGAIDDASGCGIVTAAALYATKDKKPLRTIRVLWAGAEEVGVWGGASYSQKNRDVPHALAMESDFGADRVWRIEYRLNETTAPLKARLNKAVSRFSVAPSNIRAGGGADVGPIIVSQKLGVIDLQQDGTRYFDLHHTADDTLDKVDKAQLRQNVAVWTAVLREVANYGGALKP